MDSALRDAIRSGDPIRIIILSQRAGSPASDPAIWAAAFNALLALPSPEEGASSAEYLSAVIEAEQGAYPCHCSTLKDGSCPTHGEEFAAAASRGARYADWIRADALQSSPTGEPALESAAAAVARVVRRLTDDC